METKFFLCECEYPDHQFLVKVDRDDEDFYAYVDVHLTKTHGFWRRVKVAFKYIAGSDKVHSDFDEVILSKKRTQELSDFLNTKKI
jgi:hypothetical protein